MINKGSRVGFEFSAYQFFKTSMEEKFVKEIQQTTNYNTNDLP